MGSNKKQDTTKKGKVKINMVLRKGSDKKQDTEKKGKSDKETRR